MFLPMIASGDYVDGHKNLFGDCDSGRDGNIDDRVREHPGEEWATSCEKGIQLLAQQRCHEGMLNDYDGVSLVSWNQADGVGKHVEFIQWTVPGKKGRIADVDSSNGCLKPIVPVGAKKTPIMFDAAGAETVIVWQDTGIKPVKARWKVNQHQGKMPDHIMQLKSMWTLAVGDLREQDSELTCFICGGIQSPQLPLEQAQRCSLCLLVSHQCCMQMIASRLQDEDVNASTVSNLFSLPPTLLTSDNISENFLLHSRQAHFDL